MLLMIDNYDSFTYNLVQYLGELGADVRVYRNDRITVPEIERLPPAHPILSPGPGPTPLAGRGNPARRPRHHRLDGGRRDHGRAPQNTRGRGGAVPSGIHPGPARPRV